MRINDIKIGSMYEPLIVPEISANHNNSLETVFKMIVEAKKAGAKIIKLQTYKPDTITFNSRKKRFIFKNKKEKWYGKSMHDLFKKAHTPWIWHKKIFNYCKKLNIVCFSTPFDETAVDFLEELKTPLYKISSFECCDINLVKKIALTNKPIIISTGMASLKEIKESIKVIKKYSKAKFAILKCTSSYPAPINELNLKTIKDLKKKFKCEVGLSDHSIGLTAPLVAISYGATIIEKHYCLKKNLGIDSEFSLDPKGLKQLIKESKNAWLSKGTVNYGVTNSEKEAYKNRRSLYAVKKIKKNEKINLDNVKSIRPSGGLEPKFLKKIVGKKILRTVNPGDPITWKLVYV